MIKTLTKWVEELTELKKAIVGLFKTDPASKQKSTKTGTQPAPSNSNGIQISVDGDNNSVNIQVIHGVADAARHVGGNPRKMDMFDPNEPPPKPRLVTQSSDMPTLQLPTEEQDRNES